MSAFGSGNTAGAMSDFSTDPGGTPDQDLVFDQQEMLLCKEQIDRKLQEVLDINPNVIFIVNEMGCGVIPMEVFDRRYRELVGRVSCDLAKEAKEVHRVVCGVGTKIKSADEATEAGQNTDPDPAETASEETTKQDEVENAAGHAAGMEAANE